MVQKTFQDLLPLVEQPSRYLGTEINRVKKDPQKVRLRVALAFPDLYEIGMSHFGIQILYHILNQQKDIAAERVFAPAVDMEAFLRKTKTPLMTLETQTPVNAFDILGFSLLYELNFTTVLTILELSSIPFLSKHRDGAHPVVIAGGPCTVNPEPIADFFDAMVIGDGEETVLEIANAWLEWKIAGCGGRTELLDRWSTIPGVYVPSLFRAVFDHRGFQSVAPERPEYARVKRRIVGDLNRVEFPVSPVVAYGRPVHDRLRIEISRGCTRGCRFCQAGMIYRPVRERSMETLASLVDRSVASTGYGDISLLSLSTGDYGCILPLMERIMNRGETDHTAISLPSLRAGTLTPQLMNLIKRVRKTGFTIAPEAGSQRLRDVINKNITEQDIFDTVRDAAGLGWQVIKLYFMIGLPTETDDDLKAIVTLVKKLQQASHQKRRRLALNVSVSTFIPKPHTPFQWETQASLEEAQGKVRWLRDRLDARGIHFKWQNPEVSVVEGLWARGDRRLGPLLIRAFENGCRLDGWSDRFRFDLWKTAMQEMEPAPNFFTQRKRNADEPLPWDHIDTGVKKEFLKKESEKAFAGESTPDCRSGRCNDCGVCDFNTIHPRTFVPEKPEHAFAPKPVSEQNRHYQQIGLCFSKTGPARFFGHLEVVNIFIRALRRVAIPVKYSGGFHPMPKISFGDPLPIGMESLEEICFLTVAATVNPERMIRDLNEQLPEGLLIHRAETAPARRAHNRLESVAYQVFLKNGAFDRGRLEKFNQAESHFFTRTNPKGRLKKINLKNIVLRLDLVDASQVKMILGTEASALVRPDAVVKEVFHLTDKDIKTARVVKLGKGV